MARAHCISQRSHVSVYRFVSKDTMEKDILERARNKMVLEYASAPHSPLSIPLFLSLTPMILVINQMDTSQAHLSGKANGAKEITNKSDNLSKDELQAVLK